MQKDETKDILEQGDNLALEAGAEGSCPGTEKGSAISRRGAMIGAGGIAALAVLGGLRYAGHNPLVHPPGGQDEKHLVSACIRCEKCYEACPRKVIMPSHIEDGLLGMRAPKMNFESNYCDFCAEEYGGQPHCVQVCPTGALRLPDMVDGYVLSNEDADPAYDGTVRKKILIKLGTAEINTDICLAYRQTGCRKCYDNCPFGAISLNATASSTANPLPVVDPDKCNGCGACQSICIGLTAGSVVDSSADRPITVHPDSES